MNRYELANELGALVQRWDIYPKQIPDGRYVAVPEPLHTVNLVNHLAGVMTLGVYLLDQKSRARFCVLDADDAREFGQLKEVAQEVPAYLETSRRGGHLWMFFDGPKDGVAVKEFGRGLQTKFNLNMEFYPKQGKLESGPGSLIRLPLGVHKKTGQRYPLVGIEDLEEQVLTLAHPKTIADDFFEAQRVKADHIANVNKMVPFTTDAMTFIGQFVELKKVSSGGLGRCPFHDDQHPSFGVNARGNYWHCFAGCGGGDVVSFYARLKGIKYGEALRELKNG